MKKILLTIILSIMIALPAFAEEGMGNKIVPYGDYCRNCSIYGGCKTQLEFGESMKAIKIHFEELGLEVRVVKHRGRFVIADILRHGRPVDKIIFDRKTGRVRSVY